MGKNASLRDLRPEELEEKYRNLRKELFELENDRRVRKLTKPHRLQQMKREIARTLTLLHEGNRGDQ